MEGDLSQEAVVILNPGIGYNVADGHGHNQAKGSLDLNSLRKLKKKMSNDMKIKTISDYPLLVGEILRRSELRKNRRQRRAVFFRLDRTRST